jgi:hypothetical protein
MKSEPVVLTARRSYEFPPDAIRLSALSTALVQANIRAAFGFQSALVGSPMPTFGPVIATLPPGVVFDWGAYESDDGTIAPIRFIHFEPTRIVIDVAAHSSEIDAIYERLQSALKSVRLSSGLPVVGEPSGIADYSELLPRLDISLEELLRDPVGDFLRKRLCAGLLGSVFVPGFVFQAVPSDQPYPGAVGSDQYVLQLRAGTMPGEGPLFSSAPLTTSDHTAYLTELEAALSPAAAGRSKRRSH